MKQWWMSVGNPGGEVVSTNPETVERAVSDRFCRIITTCPQDLVEWIESEGGVKLSVDCSVYRYKVPGGWIYHYYNSSVFVPIAGAAGITILEEKN